MGRWPQGSVSSDAVQEPMPQFRDRLFDCWAPTNRQIRRAAALLHFRCRLLMAVQTTNGDFVSHPFPWPRARFPPRRHRSIRSWARRREFATLTYSSYRRSISTRKLGGNVFVRLSTSDGTLFAIFAVSQSARPALSCTEEPAKSGRQSPFRAHRRRFSTRADSSRQRVAQGRDF